MQDHTEVLPDRTINSSKIWRVLMDSTKNILQVRALKSKCRSANRGELEFFFFAEQRVKPVGGCGQDSQSNMIATRISTIRT